MEFDYNIEYIKKIFGEKKLYATIKFFIPFFKKYSLTIDVNKSNDRFVLLNDANGEYTGLIEMNGGSINFIVELIKTRVN